MNKIEELRKEIRNHFESSQRCRSYFLNKANQDEYAAYYTAMYLLQDSTEGLAQHREKGFSPDPFLAYIELWGVLQAIIIQQDSIKTLFEIFMGTSAVIPEDSKWTEIKHFRNQCSGHPVDQGYEEGSKKRTFMGRRFGGYNGLMIEVYDENTKKVKHESIRFGELIDDYVLEAVGWLHKIILVLPDKWP